MWVSGRSFQQSCTHQGIPWCNVFIQDPSTVQRWTCSLQHTWETTSCYSLIASCFLDVKVSLLELGFQFAVLNVDSHFLCFLDWWRCFFMRLMVIKGRIKTVWWRTENRLVNICEGGKTLSFFLFVCFSFFYSFYLFIYFIRFCFCQLAVIRMSYILLFSLILQNVVNI